jgi:hypothetical protein
MLYLDDICFPVHTATFRYSFLFAWTETIYQASEIFCAWAAVFLDQHPLRNFQLQDLNLGNASYSSLDHSKINLKNYR